MSLEEVNRQLQEKLREEGLIPRGMALVGKVVSTRRRKTVTVMRELIRKVGKYKRYAREVSKVHAHVPEGVDIKEGDIVEIRETRKISKTKNFVVWRIIKRGEAS